LKEVQKIYYKNNPQEFSGMREYLK